MVRALSPLPFVLKLVEVYDRVDIQLGSIHQWIIVQVTAVVMLLGSWEATRVILMDSSGLSVAVAH